jgi:hypothetical protein
LVETLLSTELETIWLKDDELRYDRCLCMDSTRVQTCPALVEGCQN